MPFFFFKKELLYRFFFLIFSFLLCFFVFYYKSEILLTFLTYPFIKINFYKRLIALNFNDLFHIYWSITIIFSFIFWYPFLLYQISNFFRSAWYLYQIFDLIIINFNFWLCYVFGFFFTWKYLISFFCVFFLQGELIYFNNILLLEIETYVKAYINWIFICIFVFSNIIIIIVIILYQQKWNISIHLFNIYIRLNLYFIIITLNLIIFKSFYLNINYILVIFAYEMSLFFCFIVKIIGE